MLPQLDSVYARNLDLLRNLSAMTLTGSEELMRCQLDNTQALIARGCQQSKEFWSGMAGAKNAADWQGTLQDGFCKAMDMARDCMAATSEYQTEALRLMQKQTGEVQGIVNEALSSLAAIEEGMQPAREKRATKAAQVTHKLAA